MSEDGEWIKNSIVELELKTRIEFDPCLELNPAYFNKIKGNIIISGHDPDDPNDVKIGTIKATFFNLSRCYNDHYSVLEVGDAHSQELFDDLRSVVDPKSNNIYTEVSSKLGDGAFLDLLIIDDIIIDPKYDEFYFDLKAVRLLVLQLGYSALTIFRVKRKYESYWKKLGFKRFNPNGISVLALTAYDCATKQF